MIAPVGRPRAWRLLAAALLLPFFLYGCRATPDSATPAATDSGPASPEPGDPPALEETASPTAPSGSAGTGPVTLRIWLPPRFTPDRAVPAGALLDDRLDEFALLHPGIRITVRVKAESGPGGMVASLEATSGAAPEALPDLVLMPRTEMERAAAAGLLTPLPDQLEPDFYEFARELAAIDQVVYGYPCAADALLLVYRPAAIASPPRDWTTTLNQADPLLFAGGSATQLFAMALYEAAGGRLLDSEGRPFLDAASLSALLGFFAEGAAAGVFTERVASLTTPEAVYQSFANGEADMGIVWASDHMLIPVEDAAATGLPTVTSVPYTLVKGWAWVLTNPDPDRFALARELAEFLTLADFQGPWTLAAGAIPTRASALASWPDSPNASLTSRIVLSARPLPSLEVLENTGPVLLQAVQVVLNNEVSPEQAAQTAADRLNAP